MFLNPFNLNVPFLKRQIIKDYLSEGIEMKNSVKTGWLKKDKPAN